MQHRSVGIMVAAIIVGAIAGLGAHSDTVADAQQIPDRVSARSFAVVGPEGRTRALLSADQDATSLILFGGADRPILRMTAGDERQTGVRLYDRDGTLRFFVSLDDQNDEIVLLALQRPDGGPAVVAGGGRDLEALLAVCDSAAQYLSDCRDR